jgi:LCP family protein required for cell wall assembly
MQRIPGKRQTHVRRKRQKKRILLILSLFILIMGVAGLFFGTQIWNLISGGHKNLEQSRLRQREVELREDPFTVLLIGTDQRKPDSRDWRSDVLILVAVNPRTHSMKVVSIPRDTYVKIACADIKTRINSAAYYGFESGIGPIRCIRETVENLLQVPVDEYAKINFQGFENIVDLLGGVEVHVKQEFSQAAIGGRIVHFKLGPMHLSGSEALAYVRKRKGNGGGDLGRNDRQREVVAQLVDKLITVKGITKLPEISRTLGKNFEHSLSLTEMPTLAGVYQQIPKQNIETIELTFIPQKIRGMDLLILPDEERERLSRILKEHLELIPKGSANPGFSTEQP